MMYVPVQRLCVLRSIYITSVKPNYMSTVFFLIPYTVKVVYFPIYNFHNKYFPYIKLTYVATEKKVVFDNAWKNITLPYITEIKLKMTENYQFGKSKC